ncbi:MAG: hypothetical protein ABIA63_10670 [bacterium]
MIKSYEATYKNGTLEWSNNKPDIEDGDRVLIVVETQKVKQNKEYIKKALNEAWGAWGNNKTIDKIDKEVVEMRTSDWVRNFEVNN